MADMGPQAVIAPSFSDIHAGNAFKNGILTVVLPQAQVDRLLEVAKEYPIAIDLEAQTVTTPYQDRFHFEIDPFRKDCLLKGLDEIGITLGMDEAIVRTKPACTRRRRGSKARRRRLRAARYMK